MTRVEEVRRFLDELAVAAWNLMIYCEVCRRRRTREGSTTIKSANISGRAMRCSDCCDEAETEHYGSPHPEWRVQS